VRYFKSHRSPVILDDFSVDSPRLMRLGACRQLPALPHSSYVKTANKSPCTDCFRAISCDNSETVRDNSVSINH